MAGRTKKATTRAPAKSNGAVSDATAKLAEAIAHEEAIRVEADAIWMSEENAAEDTIDAGLLRQLRPLLRRPIPSGFIEHVGRVEGKPYESTGVKSVQVQMDRLDNVLGPPNWGYEPTYSNDGKVCHVRAWVGSKDAPLFERDSFGGVKQGTGEGNIRKGAFTNAAKLAFARLGPAWEVYVGAADFDPDTDRDAAKEQGKAPQSGAPDPSRKLPEDKVEPLRTAITAAGLDEMLPMKLTAFGVEKLEDLTVEQALAVYEWAKGEATSG